MAITCCCRAIAPHAIISATSAPKIRLIGPAHAEFPFVDLAEP